jgi:hypothetical protein
LAVFFAEETMESPLNISPDVTNLISSPFVNNPSSSSHAKALAMYAKFSTELLFQMFRSAVCLSFPLAITIRLFFEPQTTEVLSGDTSGQLDGGELMEMGWPPCRALQSHPLRSVDCFSEKQSQRRLQS